MFSSLTNENPVLKFHYHRSLSLWIDAPLSRLARTVRATTIFCISTGRCLTLKKGKLIYRENVRMKWINCQVSVSLRVALCGGMVVPRDPFWMIQNS